METTSLGEKMISKRVENDLWVRMEKLEENLDEISSVALLSPACFKHWLGYIHFDMINIGTKNIWEKQQKKFEKYNLE